MNPGEGLPWKPAEGLGLGEEVKEQGTGSRGLCQSFPSRGRFSSFYFWEWWWSRSQFFSWVTDRLLEWAQLSLKPGTLLPGPRLNSKNVY